MSRSPIYSFIIFILILSCKDSDNHKNSKENELEIKINSINIKTDTLAKFTYGVFTFKSEKDLELITYNNTSHSIEFFNLNSKNLSKRIILKSDGPKAIGNVTGLYYHNQDSIFISSRGSINIINESYSKESNPNLLALIEDYNINFEPLFNQHFRLYYIPEIKSIPIYNLYFDPKSKISAETEQISFFDLNDLKITTLDYFQTEPIESDIEYGFLNYPTISKPFDGKFLVNQIYSPMTYQYNSKTQEFTEVISADKIYHEKNKNPEDWVPHAVESNFYNQLEKLNDNIFTRILWKETEHKPKENGFLKKEYILQIFNKNFDIIDELKLPKNTYFSYTWFVANNKLYIQAGHPNYKYISEEELIIHEIELKEK
ncbi:DUF4221 family protein [Marivirga sp.]|uniref:DUF4221 family protein n=1 Tax=Marivirga sp. TaxID=2018662 RepID=UPI002D7EDD45|nr:DUF4221 family protein [Marivirga sp.]HET8858911.1 DUF4221 family protein [Marivirga sp.]